MVLLLNSILTLLLCPLLPQDIVLMPDALPVVSTSVGVEQASPGKPLDKKELDDRVSAMIRSVSSEPIVPSFQPANPAQLVLHKTADESILRTEGSIYMIDQISNDLFFSTAGDKVCILWDAAYPGQSMSNLLLGQIAQPSFAVDLTHHCYGLEHPMFKLSWEALYHVLCSPGSRVYASGHVQQDGENVRGVLVIHQPLGNYLHMLVVTTSRQNLFAPDGQRQPLKGNLFTNIPQQNILNLYE